MHEITLAHTKDHSKIHSLRVSESLTGGLFFDEGDYVPGREEDELLLLAPEDKPKLLRQLDLAFAGISATCGETSDDRLFCTLLRLAELGHWHSLSEVEAWMLKRGIPFKKQRQVVVK